MRSEGWGGGGRKGVRAIVFISRAHESGTPDTMLFSSWGSNRVKRQFHGSVEALCMTRSERRFIILFSCVRVCVYAPSLCVLPFFAFHASTPSLLFFLVTVFQNCPRKFITCVCVRPAPTRPFPPPLPMAQLMRAHSSL